MTSIQPKWQNYINGAFVPGSEGNLSVENPATGEHLAWQASAGTDDVDQAVAAARACVDEGRLTAIPPVERGRMVRKIGEILLDQIDEIAPVLTLESGKPLWEARIEVEGTARYFEYYGNQAETLEGRSIPIGQGYMDFTVYEPYGVSAQIIPWNYPLEMTARSLSTALVTGNACVVKTPELDPLSNSYIAMAAEQAGWPKGAVNILCGTGPLAGAHLAGHQGINQLVFTGSVATGISVAQRAAANLVPSVLELGGKSAAIICPDADLDTVLSNIRWGIFFNAGQVCSAMSRVIVHEDLHDRLLEGITDLASGLSVGPGIDRPEFGPNMGAMISGAQRDRAGRLCREAETEGARLVTGGHAPNRPGFFMQPTVFADVAPDSAIAQTEVFGPVLSMFKYRDLEQAIAITNQSEYGLVGGVFGNDLDGAMDVAGRLQVGQVFVNEWYAGGVAAPFGGYKKSGYGREKGREALLNYVQTKNIAIKYGSS